MSQHYDVRVIYDSDQGTLAVESGDLELAADTSPIYAVAWQFEGIDDLVERGWCPRLQFEAEVGPPELHRRQLGPFVDICMTRSAVIAAGFSAPGAFRYRAVLEPPPELEGPILSETAGLDASLVLPAPAAIQVTGFADSKVLKVEPVDVAVYEGQCLCWEVAEAPTEIRQWYPRVVFGEVELAAGGGESADRLPYFGPFGAFHATGPQLLGVSAVGPRATYKYLFQLLTENGELIAKSSPDPLVDKEGDPADDGGGDIVTKGKMA